MSKENDPGRKRKRKKNSPTEVIRERLDAMDTYEAGPLSVEDRLKAQLSRKTKRRDLLVSGAMMLGMVVGGAVLREPLQNILEGQIGTPYGMFLPFYGEKELNLEKLPKNLDYFFIEHIMREDGHKMTAAELLGSTDFPPGILEYLAQNGITLAYADGPGGEDIGFRNAIMADKMLALVQNKYVAEGRRPINSAFFLDSNRKNFTLNIGRKDVGSLLSGGFNWIEEVIFSHYNPAIIDSSARASGSLENLFTIRTITLPRGLTESNFRSFNLRIDDSVRDNEMIKQLRGRVSNPLFNPVGN